MLRDAPPTTDDHAAPAEHRPPTAHVGYTPKRDEALFQRDGDLLVPGTLTKGPWYEGTMHGSAMLAAIAQAAERHPSDVPRQVVRLTVDMMRAAPMTPLRIETSTTRAGKNIDYVDIAMLADDELCVRASALRIRTADVVINEFADPNPIPQPPAPDAAVVSHFRHPEAERPAFHHAIDISVDADPGVAWFRLAVPIVDREPTSGFVAVATVADWTYSIPNMIDDALGGGTPPTERTVFSINADTTINVHRPLAGRWVGLRSLAHLGPLGAGTSAAQLFDDAGPLGFTSQSLLLRGPSGAPLSVRAGSA